MKQHNRNMSIIKNTKYTISLNYGEIEFLIGEDYEAADRAYGKACDDYPNATVTLLADEEMIKEREVDV
jgi:hypothetical protein